MGSAVEGASRSRRWWRELGEGDAREAAVVRCGRMEEEERPGEEGAGRPWEVREHELGMVGEEDDHDGESTGKIGKKRSGQGKRGIKG